MSMYGLEENRKNVSVTDLILSIGSLRLGSLQQPGLLHLSRFGLNMFSFALR